MSEIRETSTIVRSMNRARDDAIRCVRDVLTYHRRQIAILYENRCEGYGEAEGKIFSRDVLELRRKMLGSISHELMTQVDSINKEIIDIDISLRNDVFSDKEGIVYIQRGRKLPISQKRR